MILGNQMRSSLVSQQVMDPALSLLQLEWLLWHRFHSWPGNFHVLWVQPKRKKKNRNQMVVFIATEVFIAAASSFQCTVKEMNLCKHAYLHICKKNIYWVHVVVHWKWTWLVSIRTWVQSLASLNGLRIWFCLSYGVDRRCGSGPRLLWHRPAAIASIRPLAWELPHGMGVALKKEKKKKTRNVHTWNFNKLHSGLESPF